MKVVKMITDDSGDDYWNNHWHYISNWGDAPRVLCDGHVFGEGESSAEYETKIGKVSCPSCIKIIKEMKAVKL